MGRGAGSNTEHCNTRLHRQFLHTNSLPGPYPLPCRPLTAYHTTTCSSSQTSQMQRSDPCARDLAGQRQQWQRAPRAVWRDVCAGGCGLPARLLAGRLRSLGVAPASLSAILLTHEHGDHSCGALSLACQHGIPILSDPRTIDALMKQPSREARPAGWTPERVELPVGRSTRLGSLEIRSFPISHDAVAPCGFTLATSAWRVGVVTDTGVVGPQAVEALRRAHLLVIEANHDQRPPGGRPLSLVPQAAHPRPHRPPLERADQQGAASGPGRRAVLALAGAPQQHEQHARPREHPRERAATHARPQAYPARAAAARDRPLLGYRQPLGR